MKLTMTEVRDLVAETLRRTIKEARDGGKKPKEIPPRSEESIEDQAEKQVRATGHQHCPSFDYSQPLGTASHSRKHATSNIGGWTKGSDPRPPAYGKVTAEQKLRKLVEMIVAEELRAIRG